MLIIKWLTLAAQDFEEAMQYIHQANPEAAERVARRIWELTQKLAHHPGQGRPGRVNGTRELVISETPYIVPYRVVDNRVEILRVLHTSRQWPQRL